METINFIEWYDNEYHKGAYVPIVKATLKGDFLKVTKLVGRFVNYYKLKSVIAKGKTEDMGKKRDYEKTIIPHVLKENLNTKNTLLMVYKTNHHRAYSTYYYCGMEITEEEYYLGIGEKKKDYGDTPLFMFKLNEIVSVGGKK